MSETIYVRDGYVRHGYVRDGLCLRWVFLTAFLAKAV